MHCSNDRIGRAGERTHLLRYLSEQTLHVDVWDGDSLLLVGSCALELKRLCRQGREAVQVSYELDVVRTEYFEEISSLPGSLLSSPLSRSIVLYKLHTLLQENIEFYSALN